jgi:4-hydroxy-tetrahydrodipicolinate synthase
VGGQVDYLVWAGPLFEVPPMKLKNLEGSFTALATPFRNGEVDADAYRALIRHQLANGTSGLVPIGSTGEAATLSADERAQVVKLAVEGAAGKVPVIAGAGSNSTRETAEAVGRMRDLGADAALVVTPYYNKPTQDGLVEHYRAIARANPGFPLVLYNVPGRTGGDLLPETCERLCELPEVIALKEATGSLVRALELRERCKDRLTLLSGDDFTVLPFIACGGTGVISVSSNVAPKLMAELVRSARAKDLATALELQLRLSNLHRLLFIETSPIPVKWALHRLGLCSPELRLPLLTMTSKNAALLDAELKALGLV